MVTSRVTLRNEKQRRRERKGFKGKYIGIAVSE
jgi:hypothetical protein